MSRRLTLAVFALLPLAPATATADERDNARAFADITLRAQAGIIAAQKAVGSDSAPRCRRRTG